MAQYLAKRVMPVLEGAMIDKQRETVRLPVRCCPAQGLGFSV